MTGRGLHVHGLDARVDDTVAGGREAAARLLDAAGPTAYVCASDTLAVGVLHTLDERGLRAGRDVGVVGFDDSQVAQVVPPGLTSVRQPLEQAAVELVRVLEALLAREPYDGRGVLLRPTLAVRLVTLGLTAVLSLLGALAATSDFLRNFNDFLLLVLYLFIPWTAVNLTDYYVVRRGHYAIAEIFDPHGVYGRWGWQGITSYLAGFAAMVPFFSVGRLFVGPAARALGGADISLFVGLPVSALLYWWLTRSIDVAAEQRLAEAEAAALERAAHEHREP